MSRIRSGMLALASRHLERAAVEGIIDGPSVAREMFDWADAHAVRISGSPLEIKSDKPLLFWGADQGRARDERRKVADVAMSALRRGVAR